MNIFKQMKIDFIHAEAETVKHMFANFCENVKLSIQCSGCCQKENG